MKNEKSTSKSELVQEWLNGKAKPKRRFLIKTDETTQANIGGMFLGKNESDPSAQGKEIFDNPKNLPTAVATILQHSQNKADFHPSFQQPLVVAEKFREYLREIDSVPFLSLSMNDKVQKSYKEKNYDKLINEIVSLYDGFEEKDKAKLKESIRNIASSLVDSKDTELYRDIFSQATIRNENKEMEVVIYYTNFSMKRTEKKGEVTINQNYTVNRVVYTVLSASIKAHADVLAKLTKTDVDDWIDKTSTPTNPALKLCF